MKSSGADEPLEEAAEVAEVDEEQEIQDEVCRHTILIKTLTGPSIHSFNVLTMKPLLAQNVSEGVPMKSKPGLSKECSFR